MTEQPQGEWEGRSRTSFAEAAYQAVERAEEELGEKAPQLYDVTLRVSATPGSSLSEYIALARGSG
jgi:hypothetical protein